MSPLPVVLIHSNQHFPGSVESSAAGQHSWAPEAGGAGFNLLDTQGRPSVSHFTACKITDYPTSLGGELAGMMIK